jgi:antitoxin component YwqK of YwqJK toxin-antitoxin module
MYSYYLDYNTNSAYILYGDFEIYNYNDNLKNIKTIWNLDNEEISSDKIIISGGRFRVYSTYEQAFHMIIYIIFFESKYYMKDIDERYLLCKKLRESITYTGDLCIYGYGNKLTMKFFHVNGVIYGKLYHYLDHYIEEIEFLNGVKNGEYKKLTNSGELVGHYYYQNNLIHGSYLDKFRQVTIKCEYKNGKRNGIMIMYNNNIYVETYYVDDLEDGLHREYKLPNHTLISQCEYKNGKKNGVFITYDKYNEYDTKLVQTYVNDELHGISYDYLKVNGEYILTRQIEYKNRNRDGKEIVYSNGDIIKQKYYKDNKKYKEIDFVDNSESIFKFTHIAEYSAYDEYSVEIETTKDGKTEINLYKFCADNYTYYGDGGDNGTWDYIEAFDKRSFYFPGLKDEISYYEFGVNDKKLFMPN